MKIQSSSEDLWPICNNSRKLPEWQSTRDASGAGLAVPVHVSASGCHS